MKTISVTFSLLILLSVNSLSQINGKYLQRDFESIEYKAHPRNSNIIQDKRGMMYLSNEIGVLEYDGINWRLIPIENNSRVVSIAIDSLGVIYAGGLNCFGYLVPDKSGTLKYKSLTTNLDTTHSNFGYVWRISCTESGIYFKTTNKIFRLNYKAKEHIKTFECNSHFSFTIEANGVTYSSIIGEKIIKFVNDEIVYIENTEDIAKDLIFVVLPWENNKVLMGFHKYIIYDPETNNIVPWVPEDKAFFEKSFIYGAKYLETGNILFYTVDNGIAVINKAGKILSQMNTDTNLKNSSVPDVWGNKNTSLWLASGDGITRIEMNSPIRYWDKNSGIKTGIFQTIKYKDEMYINTKAGLITYSKKLNKFVPAGCSSMTEMINFKYYTPKNTIEEKMILGSMDGVYSMENGKVKNLIKKDRCFQLHSLQDASNRIFTGQFLSFFSMKIKDGKWIIEKEFKEIKKSAIALESDSDKNIWLSTADGKLNRYIFTDKDSIINSVEDYIYEQFDNKNGIPVGANIKIARLENHLTFLTAQGLYKFVEKDKKFVPDYILGESYTNGNRIVTKIIKDGNKDAYFVLYNYDTSIEYFVKDQKTNKYILGKESFKRLQGLGTITNIYVDKNRDIWISIGKKLYKYERNKKQKVNNDFRTYIRKVVAGRDSVIFNGTNFNEYNLTDSIRIRLSDIKQSERFKVKLAYNLNSLKFNFAAPFFESEERTKYSYILEGYDKSWSEWRIITDADYSNLPPGKYTFKAKAKNIYDKESEIASFEFSIPTPWYLTTIAFISYITALILLIFIIVKLYTRKLKAQNIKLEKIVTKRTLQIVEKNQVLKQQTEEITAQNEELIQHREEILAQNDKLIQHREEIIAQKDAIQSQNTELEKLSIVASETDNAVMIMDSECNIEWINHGFTKLYGHNHDDFLKDSPNLLKISSNPKLGILIDKCKTEKVSVNYKSKMDGIDEEKIWVQTTITPIFENNEKLKKFIAIDSDITHLVKAETQIRNKNKLITSSINYAKTIQQAILPSVNEINKELDSFVIFRPKDIVSGDFYWYTKIAGYIFVAVVDCTGHGVPGAFMSMIGTRLLDEIIIQNLTLSPSEILNELNYKIQKALKQKETSVEDGMDVCLCRFDAGNKKNLVFAGAKRDLLHVIKNKGKLNIVKGDRKSIGGSFTSTHIKEFTNKEITLAIEDVIYLTTDGYIDQNDKKRKRFGSRIYYKMLVENADKTMSEQKIIYENALDDWQIGESQRDDIAIVGIRLK